jgi:serine/threonine protein kinase
VRKHIKSAKEEVKIIKKIHKKLHDPGFMKVEKAFDFNGHYVMVCELLGLNLYDLLRENHKKGFPLYVVQKWAKQILTSLKNLHSIGYVHTDLKVW